MTTDSKIHPLQKFEARTIHRSQIKEASYNPRLIEAKNKSVLGNNLEKRGLLEALVWNENTGNLVSGHQRLSKLDAYYKRKHKNLDYSLTVAVIHLSLTEEKEQNVFFNNHRAMGLFDDDKLMDIFKDTEDFDPIMAGMNDEDISFFGLSADLDNMETAAVDDIIQEFEDRKVEEKQNIPPEVKEQRKQEVKAAKVQQKNNEVDTYVTISFSNQADKRAFMKKIGEQEEGNFIKGEMFVQKYFS
jgi:hypothetical protein